MKLKELVKIEKKLQEPYLKNHNLLTAQDLWQILFIILLKKFINLNVNTDMIINNEKNVELNIKIVSAVLNTQALKMI